VIQKRVKSGDKFENIIAEEYGYKLDRRRSSFVWGDGENRIKEVVKADFQAKKFKLNTSLSKMIKGDVVDKEGNRIEIKRELIMSKPFLFFEPFKLTSMADVKKMATYANLSIEETIKRQNEFIYDLAEETETLKWMTFMMLDTFKYFLGREKKLVDPLQFDYLPVVDDWNEIRRLGIWGIHKSLHSILIST
jgi:hypothetical protein